MKVHLVDGTYELFRYHFAMPSHVTADGRGGGGHARRGRHRAASCSRQGATHVGVATDHVVASFRNDLWPGYKTDAGMPPELLAQFPLVEEALEALGVVVWPMVEFEADDAMGTAAAMAAADGRVEQVIICTPDKDLGQCVVGDRVVQLDRRKDVVFDEAGVLEKMGVPPASIPDYLALVGDSADGFPGLPGWGAKSAAAVLTRFGSIEAIPDSADDWDGLTVRGAAKLAATLAGDRELAMLFRRIATVVTDVPGIGTVDDLAWTGPTDGVRGRGRAPGRASARGPGPEGCSRPLTRGRRRVSRAGRRDRQRGPRPGRRRRATAPRPP